MSALVIILIIKGSLNKRIINNKIIYLMFTGFAIIKHIYRKSIL